MTDTEIPTVDIAPWLAADSTSVARTAVVEAVRDACITYGFFQLVGHGVPIQLQQRVLQCSEDFFSLPMDQKLDVSQKKAMGKSARGYEVLQGQTLQTGALPDLKEGFFVGPEMSAEDPRAGKFLQGPNLWPTSLRKEDFEAPLQDYRRRMVTLAEHVLQILANGLPGKNDESLFDEFMTTPSANLRLLHYPPQTSKHELQLGAGAHTDFGGITFVLQQPGTAGLQVWYPPTQTWIPVPAKEDTFVFNIGDLLQRWTGGYYRSSVHRVLNIGDSHRYSAPFFYNGNVNVKFAPLDGAAPTTVEEHIRCRLVESLQRSQPKGAETVGVAAAADAAGPATVATAA